MLFGKTSAVRSLAEFRTLGVPIVDFHSHILPGMDDGSSSVGESLEMIRVSEEQGVKVIALTPHFYADRTHPDRFLEKREKSFGMLSEAYTGNKVRFVLGAELQYFEGMAQMDELPLFRIGDSACLLIEMPFRPWTNRMVEDILDVNSRRGFHVVLAHVERYFGIAKPKMLETLFEDGVSAQLNGESFLRFGGRHPLYRMINGGCVRALGSDSHNMTTRKPCLEEAYCRIFCDLGEETVRMIAEDSMRLLGTSGRMF